MSLQEKIASLQDKLNITKGELLFSAVLLIGLVFALILKVSGYNGWMQSSDDLQNDKNIAEFIRGIDSLDKIDNSTFIGIDNDNNVDTLLKSKDTIVKDYRNDFSSYESKKKETIKSKINLNTASKEQLMNLPGVGEKTAENIIDYRKTTKFTSIEDIMNIKGIGQKKFEKMQNFIIVK